jgi:hypothetical protein
VPISSKNKRQLMEYIKIKIEKNFQNKYITHNLIDTIIITPTETGFKLEIPAQMYDFKEWNRHGVIVPYGNGSYAQRVNKKGGFSKTHKNYVEDSIDKAIRQWLKDSGYKMNGKVTKS